MFRRSGALGYRHHAEIIPHILLLADIDGGGTVTKQSNITLGKLLGNGIPCQLTTVTHNHFVFHAPLIQLLQCLTGGGGIQINGGNGFIIDSAYLSAVSHCQVNHSI